MNERRRGPVRSRNDWNARAMMLAQKGYEFGEPNGTVGSRVSCRSGPRRFVAAEPVRGLLAPLIGELGVPTVASLAGCSSRNLLAIVNGGQGLVTVAMADLLICNALDDPSLWHTTPGLELRDQMGRLL